MTPAASDAGADNPLSMAIAAHVGGDFEDGKRC